MQYVKECLQLLYWIYFKPYTLARHVQSICPEIIDPYMDNFYRRSAAAKANPRLQRYDVQGWWLAALVPIAAVFLYAPLEKGAARLFAASLHFNWLLSSLFLLGWLLGLLIVRASRSKLGEKSAWLLIAAAMALLLASQFPFKHGIVSKEAADMAAGVAVNVVSGVATGVAFGMATGVSFIFGVLRLYFWLPELLWMLCLKRWPGPVAAKLRCLPPQFDQLIILPLPFLPGLIAEAYQENQAAARQTISYLISSTNQQKTAGKAMLLIAAESFSRCGSAKAIAPGCGSS